MQGDEVVVVAPEDRTVVMRVNTDIDNMTLGAGNHFTFKVGSKYKVSEAVYDHLEELGYVYH